MALAIDASTPAMVATLSAANATLTTASFTPPLGAMLVVMFQNSANTTLQNAPTNTGGAVTWQGSATVTEAANGCASSIWYGTVTTSASMTVTGHNPAATNTDWAIGVAVVTGQAASPVGGTQVATSASGAPSGTIASLTGSNSLVLGSIDNFTNATVGSAGSNQTQTFNGHAFSWSDGTNGDSGWCQYDTRMNLAAGSSDTINSTNAVAYSLTMLEILAATTAAAGFEFGVTPALQPVWMPHGV